MRVSPCRGGRRRLLCLLLAVLPPGALASPRSRRRRARHHATALAAEDSVGASAAPDVGQQHPPNFFAEHPSEQSSSLNIDDFEEDPSTGLRLPRFWRHATGAPDDGDGLDGLVDPSAYEGDGLEGLIVNQPTILLSVASYRDFQCAETVGSALSMAAYPERISVAVVDQGVLGAGDPDCTPMCDTEEARAADVRCKHLSRIRVYWMDARNATGPILARHIASRMYRGEAFVLQVDAHVAFALGWDEDLLKQWRSTGNENAVLSTYLSDVPGSLDEEGHTLRTTRPIMCVSAFAEGDNSVPYMRHGAQPEEPPLLSTEPMLQPFWAAGFSFARGHFVARVPYDCCLPFVFQGEEVSMGLRGWTHGYDFYAPYHSVVFHEYAQSSERRRPVAQFWENREGKEALADDGMRRLTALAGLDPTPSPQGSFNDALASRYGLGSARNASLYFKLFLIDRERRQAENLCPFVRSGAMHRNFQKHLRANGKGIDYQELEDFDTVANTPEEPQPQPARRVAHHFAWL